MGEPFLEVVGVAASKEVKGLPAIARVGSSKKYEVYVADRRVSKRHAEIRRQGQGFVLCDLKSKSGLFVNGDRVQERPLEDGDVLTFGSFELPRVVFHQPPQKSAPTATPSSSQPSDPADISATQDLQNLARFLEFSRMFAGGIALKEVLDRVVDMAMDITAAERGFLILNGPDDHLEFEVVRGAGVGALSPEHHRVSETIVREVLETRTPRVVCDVSFDQELAQAQSIVSLELGSAVAMPLLRQSHAEGDETGDRSTDDVFGVLYLDSRKRRDAFSKLDLGLLQNLTRDASSAIENAGLLREAEDKRRMEREIKTAREVQTALLPESYWSAPHFAVHGTCVPCLDLGGDYVGQFRLSDGRVAHVVADVCGKGIPASLFAAALQGALAAKIRSERPLGEIVERVNRVICELAPVANFISMICCVLTQDGELHYVNAGHCPLLLLSESGVQSLVTKGVALGIDESLQYAEGRVRMQEGDVAVLYTDGVTETDRPDGELYGDERLEAVIAKCHNSSPEAIAEKILASVESFRGAHPVADDLTLLVLRYQGDGSSGVS